MLAARAKIGISLKLSDAAWLMNILVRASCVGACFWIYFVNRNPLKADFHCVLLLSNHMSHSPLYTTTIQAWNALDNLMISVHHSVPLLHLNRGQHFPGRPSTSAGHWAAADVNHPVTASSFPKVGDKNACARVEGFQISPSETNAEALTKKCKEKELDVERLHRTASERWGPKVWERHCGTI